MAKSILAIGMEVAQGPTHLEIRLVEMASSAEGLEITNFAVEELPPGGIRLLGPRLEKLLQEKGFTAKTIDAIIPFPSIDYHLASLPPMSSSDLKTAIGREARKDIKFPPNELTSHYESLGESEEKGVRRIELLIARIQSKDMEDLLSLAGEFHLNFSTLTVVPAAMLNLLRIKGDTNETLAMVHAGTEKGTIVVYDHGNLRFPREFPIRLSAESPEWSKRLVAEIKRSLLFIKQRARGLVVNKILILGDMVQAKAVADTITSETNIPAEVYAPLGLDLSPLGDRVHEFRELLPALSIPLGLAWKGPDHSRLNLMSERLAAQRLANLAKWVTLSVGVILILLLAGNYFLLSMKTEPYTEEYNRVRGELSILRPQTREMREMQEERDALDSRNVFLGKMRGPATPWNEILRTLSLSVPKEMVLNSLDIKETEPGWTLKLSGRVVGPNANLVQDRFNDFFSLFLTCPALSDGKIESLKIGPMAVAGAVGTRVSKLDFTISMHISPKEGPGGITKR
jgi:Tfp pilus assembly PilM family ATPase/Tfp pilus assembly protein PilN